MGFSSVDDLVNEITSNGKFQRANFQKTNSAGVATQMTRTTTGALDVNTNVSPDTRHLLSMNAYTSSTVVTPATLILCDFLLYYPSCVVTGSPTVLDNTATLPRYTNGEGVMCIIDVQTAHGAASPALTLNYRDQGDADQAASFAMTAPVNSSPVSTLYAYNGGPFLPLAAGDRGVKRINSYTLASGTTGTVSFVLVKPLAEIPLLAANTASERDFLSQLPALPKIEDGACLGFILLLGGAMTVSQTIMGKIEYGWG